MTTPTPLPLDAYFGPLGAQSRLAALRDSLKDKLGPVGLATINEGVDALKTLAARVAELEANNEGSLKAATYWKEQHDRAAKRVAELERERDEARENAKAWESEADSANALGQSWMAHANALRDALQDCFEWFDARADVDHVGDPMRPFPNAEAIQREHVLAALASTPAASLAAHDAEVLERARVALNDADADCECGNISAITTDNVIRALAAQEVKP